MDELDAVLHAARPQVGPVDGETLARLRAAVVPPPSRGASGPPTPAEDGAPVEADVVELSGHGAAGRRWSAGRVVVLAAAAMAMVVGLTAVVLHRHPASPPAPNVAGGDVAGPWVAPTAEHLASRYRATKLVDGAREIPYGSQLDVTVMILPPGAGLGCRLVAGLPPSVAFAVEGERVTAHASCDVIDPEVSAFLDALGADHPTVEVRGDELRVRAGTRELDAVRPTTVDPNTLAWTTPTLDELVGSTYAMHDVTPRVQPVPGPVTAFDLTFGPTGFTVAVSGCGVASATATIIDGRLTVSGFTTGTNSMGYTPVFGAGECALSDLVSAIAKARPTVEVRADQLRLQGDGIDLWGRKTAGVNASAIEVWQVPTIEQLIGHEYKVSGIIDDGTSRDVTAYVSFSAGSVSMSACPSFWLASNPSIVDGRLIVDAPAPDPRAALIDCATVATDHLDALVRLVGAKPMIEVRGGLLRLTSGTSSVIAAEPGAVDPSAPVVTRADPAPGTDPNTVPPTTAPVVTAPSAPRTPSIDDLVGNVYVIDRLSSARIELPLKDAPVLRFAQDDTGVRVSAGACNNISGYVEVSGDRLASASVDLGDGRGPGPAWERTEMACGADRLALDDALYAFLPTGPLISLAGDELSLTSASTTLVAHRRPPVQLVGTTWAYQGTRAATPVGPVTSFAGLQATLALTTDGLFTYASSCLGGSGTYAFVGSTLTLAPASPVSAGGCQGATRDEGVRVAAVLTQPVTVAIVDRTLTLTALDGTGLTFIAA